MTENKFYKGLLIERIKDKKNLQFSIVEINRAKSLQDLYGALNCKIIDIQERVINNKYYDFIFDDEFLLNMKDKTDAVAFGTRNGEILEVIFGKLFICGLADETGQETSLNDNDIENILNSITEAEHKPTATKKDLIQYNFEIEKSEPNYNA